MSHEDAPNFLVAAVEASILLCPRDYGLTQQELQEAGQRAGFKPGQIGDAISRFGLVWE